MCIYVCILHVVDNNVAIKIHSEREQKADTQFA